MNIATADTVIPIPFMTDTRSVRLHFDFEDQKRKMTPDEFWRFCALNRKLRAELTKDGDVIIMAPTGFESSERNIEIGSQLLNWAKKNGNGKVTDSNGAYVLPNGATYAPDAAWVRKDRLKDFTPVQMKKFLPLAPDFVIELRSESDSLTDAKAKMVEWIENGVQLAWFIDPQKKQVHVYHSDRDVTILDNPASVSGEDILPDFELDLAEVWQNTITDGGELTHAYAATGEVKMTKQEIIEMIERAGFEAVERDTVYNRVEKVAA